MTVLRDGLLAERAVAVAGSKSAFVRDALAGLGARVQTLPAVDGGDEERVGEWARAHAPLDALVYCAGGAFGTGGLDAVLAEAWVAVREVATGVLIPASGPGKIVLVGPPGDAGPLAPAARAALENLARTLSVEWARYAVTVTMVAPGAGTTDEELAEVVCYLVSVAGDYVSGTRFDLGLVAR
jgi:NAD(P)-dependent dehydrogenase (short-subunit alcohol dehydrogenase family)